MEIHTTHTKTKPTEKFKIDLIVWKFGLGFDFGAYISCLK